MRNSEAGLTLIEGMITMVVVSLLLLGIVGGNIAIQQASAAAFEKTRAIQDANQVLEQIRKASETGNFPGNVTNVFPNGDAVADFTTLAGEEVMVSYEDADGDGATTEDNPLDVTVTVSWLENGTRPTSHTLKTLVTQR